MRWWSRLRLASNNDVGITTYADPTTIRKSGNKVKIWSLDDFKTVQKVGGHMSTKIQDEYDYKKKQSRGLYVSFHSENMSGGRVVYTIDYPNKWQTVPHGGMEETLWELAYGK